MPLGAPSLWPEMLMACTPSRSTSRSSQPAACTASVWNGTPLSAASRASVAICWIVPTSLLAYWMLTSVVSSRSAAASASGCDHAVVVDVEDRDLVAEPAEELR